MLNEFPHIYQEIKALALKRNQRNFNMKKKAIKKIKDSSFESDLLNEDDSSSNFSDLKDLDEFFEEARDRFPLEVMVKETNYRTIEAEKSSDESRSSSSSEPITPVSTESELDLDDIRSVGTDKIYYELEGKNPKLNHLRHP